jgi:hypothetical protein
MEAIYFSEASVHFNLTIWVYQKIEVAITSSARRQTLHRDPCSEFVLALICLNIVQRVHWETVAKVKQTEREANRRLLLVELEL